MTRLVVLQWSHFIHLLAYSKNTCQAQDQPEVLTSSLLKPRMGGGRFCRSPFSPFSRSHSHRHHVSRRLLHPHKFCNPEITFLSSSCSLYHPLIKKRSPSVIRDLSPINRHLFLKRQRITLRLKKVARLFLRGL